MAGLLDFFSPMQMQPWQTPGYNPNAPIGVAGQGGQGRGGLLDFIESPAAQIGLGLLSTGRLDTGLAQGANNLSTLTDRQTRRGLLGLQQQQLVTQQQEAARKRAMIEQARSANPAFASYPDEVVLKALETEATAGKFEDVTTPGGVVGQRNTRTGQMNYAPEIAQPAGLLADRGAIIEKAKSDATLPNQIAIRAAGKPVTNVTVDTRRENEFEKTYGGAMGKDAAAIHEGAGAARNNLARLDLLDSLMGQVETGKLAPARSTVGAWALDLGLSDETMKRFGLDPKAPMNAQGITSITNALTMGQIGAGGFPANNFSDADRKFLQETMPQLSNTPGGNRIISQAMRAGLQRNIEKEDAWLEADKRGMKYTDFLRDWNKRVKETPLFPKISSPDQLKGMKPGTVFTAPDGSIRVFQ